VCGDTECQRERHRRACAKWRRDNEDELKAKRLRARLRVPENRATGSSAKETAQIAELRLETVRDVVGLELSVIIGEIDRVLRDTVRDAVHSQLLKIMGQSDRVPPSRPRDGIAAGRAPP